MFIVFDSWEWIEREYVLVPVNCTSDDTGIRNSGYDRSTGKSSVQNQNRDFSRVIGVQNHGCTPVPASHESANAEDRQGKPPDCFARLHILNQYVLVLMELAREKVLLLPYWKITL